MKHSDFKIGIEFLTATGRWRCTDVGTRTIAAIRLDLDHDPAWYNGPPYAVVERVYVDVPEALHPIARHSVHAHLLKLSSERKVQGADLDGEWTPVAR